MLAITAAATPALQVVCALPLLKYLLILEATPCTSNANDKLSFYNNAYTTRFVHLSHYQNLTVCHTQSIS